MKLNHIFGKHGWPSHVISTNTNWNILIHLNYSSFSEFENKLKINTESCLK